MLELEKDKTNKEVAQLFGVPGNTLSTWKKNKDKMFQAFQQGSATTKRVKVDTYDQVNKAALKCFKRLKSENVPVHGVLIKEKALYFAKELTFENFQASDGCNWTGTHNHLVHKRTLNHLAKRTLNHFAPASSKEFLDIQATIECGFTLKRLRDMIRTYNRMHGWTNGSIV